ncbi:transglycosylase SLT domain-containing protein [Thiohalocapsa marina]|nr:transglycosylase SLT domain-containing protein [Thiohalocapsa marina]
MPSSRSGVVALPATALAALSLLGLVTTSGCSATGSGRTATKSAIDASTHVVSAREYGYVRPAVDVRVVGGGPSAGHAIYRDPGPGGDLWDRVRQGSTLGVTYHPRIEQASNDLRRNGDYLTDLNRRARPYLHIIVGELEHAGLPPELALLPEVESRYNPRAVSPKRAAGMWQFMPYTGTEMGLRQDGWYDARNDILASTRGAIAYLKQLRAEFDGDWALALASYNAGPARVRAAQERNRAQGKPTDYWSLDLPTETELYVPKFLAIASMVREPGRYGLRMPTLENRARLEVVEARDQIDLAQAASACGVSLQTLRDLNPGLKRNKTPSNGPHRVLVPVGTGARLRTALAQGNRTAPAVADTRASGRGAS